MDFLKRITGAAGAAVVLGYVYERVARRFSRPAREAARGRQADTPLEMPWLGWKDVLLRFAGNVADNRLSSLAGAVAFFTLLSLVPALSLLVTIYRYFTDPATIAQQLDGVTTVLPQAARELIHEQAMRLAGQPVSTLSLTFLVSFLVVVWSSNAAVKAIFDALNIIYRENEKRSFLKLNAISLMTTISGVMLLTIALILIASVPVVTALFPFSFELERMLRLVRWPIFFVVATLSIACLYWIGPSRHPARFAWVIPGAVAAALLWLAASWAFSWYVGTLGNYTTAYGSLATVVVFMTWLWLSATIVLAGAEFNAELEHQTERDTTMGTPKPLGTARRDHGRQGRPVRGGLIAVLDPETTRQHDLRTGLGPWVAGASRPPGQRLDADIGCDVAIVGAGITGALLAEHLTALGHRIVVVDREREGFGSTAASTAMLQWEIDLSLRRLAELYGFTRAADVYRRSFRAVAGLRELIARLELGCAFLPRETVYLAAGDVGASELRDEHALRRRADLPGDLLDHATLLGAFGFDRAAAIVSPGSAEADPLRLCHALLAKAAARGAVLIRDEAVAFDATGRSATVQLAGGRSIEAGHVVLATGYVMPDCVKSELHRVASSWALSTLPQPPHLLWPGPALIWEASQEYVYCRTTIDGRIIIGGEDEETDDPARRESLGPQKTQALLGKLNALLPQAEPSLGHAWSGAFGQTSDGLPLIGRVPGMPRMLAAYGYGGNGITFSYLASRLLGSLIGGAEAPWFAHFAIDRPDPARP